MLSRKRVAAVVVAGLGLGACSPTIAQTPSARLEKLDGLLPADQRVAAPTGFSGPESVRYDAEQDVYFVGNFNGPANERDNNGFISRMSPEGLVRDMRFIAGGANGVTLHAPRGMFIVGDTLWTADVDAVRGFNRRTGAPVATVDFAGFQVGFLNDIAAGGDGALYVTDTGRNRIYRIVGRRLEVAVEDSLLNRPNGITWDEANGRFIVVPFGGSHTVYSWRPEQAGLASVGSVTGAQLDGVEVLAGGAILIASQADSALHVLYRGEGRTVVRMPGRPADIGVDIRRNRVAVPFVARNQVEIWQLPQRSMPGGRTQ